MLGRHGFTLAELMVAVVVVGLLAVIAIPRFAFVKDRAYVAEMKSDLHNLATQQESYYYDQHLYSGDLGVLEVAGLQVSPLVSITIGEATATGWSATASHGNSAMECGLFVGTAAPVPSASVEGSIDCQ